VVGSVCEAENFGIFEIIAEDLKNVKKKLNLILLFKF